MEKETIHPLYAISPVDGRYHKETEKLEEYFSEYALIKNRMKIEIEWLLKLVGENGVLPEKRRLSSDEITFLNQLIENFDLTEAKRVKEIEQETKHDVKAVEYYLREKLQGSSLQDQISLIHFACTSEDINNLAYGTMVKGVLERIWIPKAEALMKQVREKAEEWKEIPMLSHTHGQSATPTTVGKELAVFLYRWEFVLQQIKQSHLKGKLNGAVGNFNAHVVAYPEINWPKVAKELVEGLGLVYNPMTTQIESHDSLTMLLNLIRSFQQVTMDFNSDLWMYISYHYFTQKVNAKEVGSSVMPHKVNPINHENSMANIRISNALITCFGEYLPISRMQRDLSDSSMLRNLGVIFAHSVISMKQTQTGFAKMDVNREKMEQELQDSPEVLAEAIQTVLRKNGVMNAYELLKDLTRGNKVSFKKIQNWIQGLDLPKEEKEKLLQLTPEQYLGLASEWIKLE